MVTFGNDQSFGGVSYDTLVIKKNYLNFWGYNTTGGISYDGIPWENHGFYTQVHEGGTSRLYNMEVVGTYTTFKPSSIHFEGHGKSTFGVSTFVIHLRLETLRAQVVHSMVHLSMQIMYQSMFLRQLHNYMQVLTGIVTDLIVTDAGISKNYSDIGITTLSHVGTEYVNQANIFTGIVTNLTVTNSATISNETVTNATITNLTVPSVGGGNSDVELANIADLTCTDITFTDDLIENDQTLLQ